MVTKMKLKEKERIDNMARRKIGKQYGFKQSSWCNWMIKERYFFYIEHDTLAKNADLYVKPCYYDDLLWLITSEDTLKKFPDSYRANGSFKAPDFCVSENVVTLEKDEDFTEDNCECVWHHVFKKVIQQIDVFLSKNPDVESFSFINNSSVHLNNNNNLSHILQMLYHKQYEDVLQLTLSLVEKGEKGCYSWSDGKGHSKYLYEYVIDYCKLSNQPHDPERFV